IDQTRGWFYTLMAIGTLVFDKGSYETVLCLGHILDGEGRKMSKHLGNVLDPHELMDKHGADAVRWYMLCGGSPWASRRIGDAQLEDVTRKVLLTWWNTASFFTLYADANGYQPGTTPVPDLADRPLLDRWAISELHATVLEVTEALEGFDSLRAGKRLERLIDDLSNWYVRVSRRRFWDGDAAALGTLHEVLEVLTRLMAPFTPFLAEVLHDALVVSVWDDLPDSVHLRDWPRVDGSLVDSALGEQVALVRRLVDLGRTARAESRTKTRQPLSRALVSAQRWETLPQELKDLVAGELNVQALERLSGDLVDTTAKANFRELGKRFGKGVQAVAQAIAAADAASLAAGLRDGNASVLVDGSEVALGSDDVFITETPREGWAVATFGAETLALDLDITPELRRSGLVRDAVRLVQDARKSSGFDVSDRIELWWAASGELAEALQEGSLKLAEEVLAVSVTEGAPTADVAHHDDADLGLRFWIRLAGR
ncbi:MAG: isoleucyl-tRNA synthase, partial [Frankiales bacterium]|nr:isoleucyl-tRNA synthase [Frankiales bacterium]